MNDVVQPRDPNPQSSPPGSRLMDRMADSEQRRANVCHYCAERQLGAVQ